MGGPVADGASPNHNNEMETLSVALQHARDLFIYHANQRLQSIRFFFIAFGVFAAGFTTLLSGVEIYSSVFGAVFALAAYRIADTFRRLDQRNAELVHHDEEALLNLEGKMAELVGCSSMKITQRGKKAEIYSNQYGVVMPKFFRFVIILSLAAFLSCLLHIVYQLGVGAYPIMDIFDLVRNLVRQT